MAEITELKTKELPPDCYVYKHSTQCSRSSQAAIEVKEAKVELPVFQINVIEQRELSNWIESEFAIRHESPQLLKIKGGILRYVWNHGDIQRKIIERSL